MDPVIVTCEFVGPDVGFKPIDACAVTLNCAVALDVPLAARTVAVPGCEDGTAKVAVKVPSDAVVTVVGTVGAAVPLKVKPTLTLAG